MENVERYELPQDDERTELREGVVKALRAVPMHFMSPINIEGLSATDLFAMNTLLGGAIEDQTVATLNATRAIWDPNGKWVDCEFRRAVFPWSLSNVISGKPILEPPYIEQAKYAADLRTYYWEHRSANTRPVEHPETHPYPEPGSSYSDIVHDDRGGNFGRIARVHGLMDEWVSDAMKTSLAGIEARWWVRFLKLFDERSDEEGIRTKFDRLAQSAGHSSEWVDEVISLVNRLMELDR